LRARTMANVRDLGLPEGIVAATLPEAADVEGRPFPLTLSPTAPGAGVEHRLEFVRAWRATLVQHVADFGAVLLRGWGPCGPKDFSDLNAALHEDTSFDMSCSAGPRNEVAPGIFTANEAPPEDTIPFHHEMAQCAAPPSHISFFCEKPAAEGGATPIIMSHLVTAHLRSSHPRTAEKLQELGVRYLRVQPEATDSTSALGKSWKVTFGETREEAEAQMAREGYTWTWLPGGGLRTVSRVMNALVIDERSGRESFFTAAETTLKEMPIPTEAAGADERPCKAVIFGDGSELDEDDKAALRDLGKFMERAQVAFAWEAGDALILNNSTVMHARQNFCPPRRILAALSGRLEREHMLRALKV